MARARTVIEGNWLLFKTPDNHDVLLPSDEIVAVWDGVDKGTVVLQRLNHDNLVIRYASVQRFAADFTHYYDERRRAPRKKPAALKSVTSLTGNAASPAAQTRTR